jgi:hypothetical protein
MPFKSYFFAFAALLMLTVSSCGKKGGSSPGGGEPPVPQEEGIKFELKNLEENGYNKASGETFTFTVNMLSAIPKNGVKVTLSVISDPGGVVLEQTPVAPSSNKTIDITLTKLPVLKTYRVIVTITSATTPTNKLVKEFLVTNKAV